MSTDDCMAVSFMAISAIKVGARHRRELGDIGGLAPSIEDVGPLHPVAVTPDGTLIAGGPPRASLRKQEGPR